MIKYFGLFRTLGIKYTLWKLYLISRKKLGLEKLLAGNHSVYDTKIKGIIPAKLFEKQTFSHPFFSDQNKKRIIKSLAELSEPLKAEAKKQAFNITDEHQIRFFSKTPKKITQIDFNFDYFEHIKWKPGAHSSTYFQFDKRYGDIKKVWELNRLQFLNPLLTAYLTSGEKDKTKIKGHLVNQLLEWFRQNPYERSVAWACSQETSVRSFQIIFYYWLLDLDEAEELRRLVPNYLFLAAEKVYKYINFARAQRNNHAITEAMFLILVSRFFEKLPKSEKYRKKGLKILEESVKDQFFDDGTYIQNSHTYQRFALQSILVVLALLEEDHALRNVLLDTVKRSYRFLKACVSNAEGDFPNYGPNDGALLFNWGNCDYRNLHSLLNLMASAIGAKETFGSEADTIDAIILGLKNDDDFQPEAEIDFPQSGFYILGNPNFKIHFRCGSYIKRYPSQCDMLHADIWHKGKNILADSGTYEYYSKNHPENFTKFLGTSAHNTVKIAVLEQMEKGPGFTWFTALRSKILEKTHNSITGEHYGYAGRVHKKTVHRRAIVLEDDRIEVTDMISGAKNRAVELFWNLGTFTLTKTGENVYEIPDMGIEIAFRANTGFKIEVADSLKSFYYAHQEYTPVIKLSFKNGSEQMKITTTIRCK